MQKIAGISGLEKEGCRIGDDENRERDCKNSEMVKNFQRMCIFGWDTGDCREDSLNRKQHKSPAQSERK